VGESLVESIPGGGVGDELTGAAKRVLQNPSTVPEILVDAGAEGGVAEESAVAGVFEGAGILPVLGGALAFGTGAGIGTMICNSILELEGCWSLHTNAADPSLAGFTGTWTFTEKSTKIAFGENTIAKPAEAYEWYWECCSGQKIATWQVTPPECGTTSKILPGAMAEAFIPATKPASTECSSPGIKWPLTVAERYSMSNRDMEGKTKAEAEGSGYPKYSGSGYCPILSPTTCGSKPPSNWAERVARGIHGEATGADPKLVEKVGESIAGHIPGSGVDDPFKVKVPDCAGLSKATCLVEIEELDLVPKVTELDWDQAVIEELDELEPEKTREEESERIIELVPPPGDNVRTGTEVTIVTNPKEEDMPEFIPKPGEGETEEEYEKDKIIPFFPFWEAEELDDAHTDPTKGPEEITRLDPGEGTRVDPHDPPHIKAKYNPATAPVPVGGPVPGTGSCNLSFGRVDWSPLNQPLGSRFPFGVFAFFVGWIGEWTSEFASPEFKFTLVPKGVFGSRGLYITADLSRFDALAEVIRVVFLFASFVGLLWFLGTAAMKVQGDSS